MMDVDYMSRRICELHGITPAQPLREAKTRLAKTKTYENAVEVQRAERQLRDWKKENIKEVKP